MLTYNYNLRPCNKVRHLRSKTHIPVEEAALLMGIPDPLGRALH
jgi:hypothetical protein